MARAVAVRVAAVRAAARVEVARAAVESTVAVRVAVEMARVVVAWVAESWETVVAGWEKVAAGRAVAERAAAAVFPVEEGAAEGGQEVRLVGGRVTEAAEARVKVAAVRVRAAAAGGLAEEV